MPNECFYIYIILYYYLDCYLLFNQWFGYYVYSKFQALN